MLTVCASATSSGSADELDPVTPSGSVDVDDDPYVDDVEESGDPYPADVDYTGVLYDVGSQVVSAVAFSGGLLAGLVCVRFVTYG